MRVFTHFNQILQVIRNVNIIVVGFFQSLQETMAQFLSSLFVIINFSWNGDSMKKFH